MEVWRLGHRSAPCDFVPRNKCSWDNRFDDPERKYRTLYCAKRSITCLREVLAALRPSKTARQDFERFFSDQTELPEKGPVSAQWRQAHVLARAEMLLEIGELADIEDAKLRAELERAHTKWLAEHGLKKLTEKELLGRNRDITKATSRFLYELDRAGVQFRSNFDETPCFALFEGRARLRQKGRAVPMTEDNSELVRVCAEFSLELEPA